jgi:chaperonin GroEL
MQGIKGLKGDNADQDAGINIVLRAMEEPIRIIVSNAGDEASVVVNAVLASKGNNGYNAATGEYGDLVAQGVIDPTKVTKTALVNAASVAALLLTTDCAICEAPKDESSGGGMPDMSGMGGMGGMGGMM